MFFARWARFLRWPNLLIIGTTMLLIRVYVVTPHLAIPDVFGVSGLAFWGMILSTVLIAAAGYVANDLADQEMDEINRPGQVFVGVHFSPSAANELAASLMVVAALSLVPLLWTAGFEWWQLIFPAAGGLLLAYAFGLKCRPVLGNLAVSVLSAAIPLLVFYADQPAIATDALPRVGALIWAYATFAFLASVFREVIKDLEDVEGDQVFGCRTLAVVRPRAAFRLALGGLFGLLIGLPVFLLWWDAGGIPWLIAVAGVGLPAGLALNQLRALAGLGASQPSPELVPAKSVLRRVSLLAKLMMLGGLVLLPFLAVG